MNLRIKDAPVVELVNHLRHCFCADSFISAPTQLSAVAVRLLLDKSGGVLYIDAANPASYYFELPF